MLRLNDGNNCAKLWFPTVSAIYHIASRASCRNRVAVVTWSEFRSSLWDVPCRLPHMFLHASTCFCRIQHENIVALEDIYESPDYLYLIMQL